MQRNKRVQIIDAGKRGAQASTNNLRQYRYIHITYGLFDFNSSDTYD